MSDLIRVDFGKKKKINSQQLPDADTIFIDQCRARLAETSAFLSEHRAAGAIMDNKKEAGHVTDIHSRFSDHEVLQAIHVGNRNDWQARPEWYAALVSEAYARDNVVNVLLQADR